MTNTFIIIYLITTVIVICYYIKKCVDDWRYDTKELIKFYGTDISSRWYKLTWGTVLSRLLVSVIPFVNFIPLFVYLMAPTLEKLYSVVVRWLDKPVIIHKRTTR